jgi:hypothetical protein
LAFYSVIVEGRDFPGELFQEPGRPYGFFTTAFIEAANAEAACTTAIEAVRDEFSGKLPAPQQPEAPEPSLHLADINELQRLPNRDAVSEATWFPMDGGT